MFGKRNLDHERKEAKQSTIDPPSKEEFEVEIPDIFFCPLTGVIMDKPFTAADGYTYNHTAIAERLRQGNKISPVTGVKLAHTELIPNYALQKAIQYFLNIRLAVQAQGPAFIDPATQPVFKLKSTNHGTERQQDSILLALSLPETVDPLIAQQSQYRQLRTAAQRGNLDKINLLLKAETDPDLGLIHGDTPIFAAIQRPHTLIFKRLLEAKANIHIKNSRGYTVPEYIGLFCPWSIAEKNELLTLLAKKWATLAAPLQACCLGETKILNQTLTQNKSSIIEAKDGKRNTAFHYAAANSRNEVLRLLDKAFPEQLLLKNEDGLTPLLLAAIAGHTNTLRWLASHGVPRTEKCKEGNTALIWAARYGRLEAVQWLIKHGASIKESNKEGNSALLWAAYQGQLVMVQWLLNHGASIAEKNQGGSTALLMATCNGQVETLQWLLTRGGASITEKNQNGSTALLIAAYYGQVESLPCLLGHGASLAERSNNGNTALIWAACKGQVETAQWLYDQGASLAEKNNIGNTALLSASHHGQIDMIAWLLKNGAALTEKNDSGRTPLLLATVSGQLKTVQWLLDHGASITQRSNNGNTALLWAVSCNHLDLAQWLLEEGGATLSEQNNQKETAFALATTAKMKELLHQHFSHSRLGAEEEKAALIGVRISKIRGSVFQPILSSPSHRSRSAPSRAPATRSITLESKRIVFKNQ